MGEAERATGCRKRSSARGSTRRHAGSPCDFRLILREAKRVPFVVTFSQTCREIIRVGLHELSLSLSSRSGSRGCALLLCVLSSLVRSFPTPP